VGVTDDGQVSGLPITDELLLSLADLRDQGNILPPPSMAVRKPETADGPVAVVEVQPSMSPPVQFTGRIHIRVGPRRSIAGPDDERRLNERRRALDLPFDARPLSGSTVDDLDLTLFTGTLLPSLQPPEVLAENHRSSDVQFLRVEGTTLTDPVKDEKRLDGPLSDVLRQLDELLMLNISTSVDFTSENREVRSPDYPLAALQQVARNAIMHRSYENTNAPVRITWFADRVEIVNPGGPYGSVTVDNFGAGATDYRNPTIAEVMRGLGYVQRFGAGIPITKKSLTDNGNPEPVFEPTQTHVAVAIRRRP